MTGYKTLTLFSDDEHTIIRKSGCSDSLKRKSGKWSLDEEYYAKQLITAFENGTLNDCEEGKTLRSYLAMKLNCAPMRISKKFAGQSIGKCVFTKNIRSDHFKKRKLDDIHDRHHSDSLDESVSDRSPSAFSSEDGYTSTSSITHSPRSFTSSPSESYAAPKHMRIMESVLNPAYSTLLVGDYQLATIQQIPQNLNLPCHFNTYSQTPSPANPAGYYPSLSTYYTTSYSSPSPSYPALSCSNTCSASCSVDISQNDDIVDEISMQDILAEASEWKDVLSYYLNDGLDDDNGNGNDPFASLANTTLPSSTSSSVDFAV